MRKLRLGGVKWLGASKWQSQYLNPGLPASPGSACFALCPVVCGLGRASWGPWARPWPVLPHIPSSPFTLPCSASQWGWPQATRNFTNICVNWLLTKFANGRHWKETGEGVEKSKVFLPSHSTCDRQKHLRYFCGLAPNRQSHCGSRVPPADTTSSSLHLLV